MGCIDLRRPSSNNTCTKVAPLSRCSRRASDANISAANSSNRRRTAASSPGVMHQSQRADAADTRANEVLLVLRSSKQAGKAPSAVSWRWWWPSPDPGFGVGVELGGGQLGGVGDLGRVGEGLPG